MIDDITIITFTMKCIIGVMYGFIALIIIDFFYPILIDLANELTTEGFNIIKSNKSLQSFEESIIQSYFILLLAKLFRNTGIIINKFTKRQFCSK